MKNKEEINLKENLPKKSFFKKVFNKHSGKKEVLKFLHQKNIHQLYFYTDVSNVLLILENGIKLIKDQKLKSNEEYIVWTYLENNNSIGLELDSSTRAHFWKWAIEAHVEVEKISVIGIDPIKLSNLIKSDWALDIKDNLIYIYETIPVEAIDFIMIKDKTNLQRIQTYITGQELNIDVYFGETGNIKEIKGKDL